MAHAIVLNGTVQNVVVSDGDFAAQQGWVEIPEGVSVESGWLYDGSKFTEPTPSDDFLKQVNKVRAQTLLQETDWAALPDLANQALTPHLVNATDFYTYRNSLRAIAINPTTTVKWPVKPTEQWSS